MINKRPTRRHALALIAAGCAIPFLPKAEAADLPRNRVMNIDNIMTGEKLRVRYLVDGQPDPGAFRAIDAIMRDWRQNETVQIDAALVDTMWWVAWSLNATRPIQLHSGYRTPRTNALLRAEGSALNSMHLRGRAADIDIPGVPTIDIARLHYKVAAWRHEGGTGFYPSTGRGGFVHIDTGAFRSWMR